MRSMKRTEEDEMSRNLTSLSAMQCNPIGPMNEMIVNGVDDLNIAL